MKYKRYDPDIWVWVHIQIHIKKGKMQKRIAAVLKGTAAIFLSTKSKHIAGGFTFYSTNTPRAPPVSRSFATKKNGGQAMKKNIFIFFTNLLQKQDFLDFRYREEKSITARKGVRF